MPNPNRTLYTYGHWFNDHIVIVSDLQRYQVTELVDVRSYPGSRRNPDVLKANLAARLPADGIAYRHEPRLGGRRRNLTGKLPSDEWWTHASFAAYATHTRTDEFQAAMRELLDGAAQRRTAVMCGEPSHTRCHRRMISDIATVLGWTVIHINPNGRAEVHQASGWARSLTVRDATLAAYPAGDDALTLI